MFDILDARARYNSLCTRRLRVKELTENLMGFTAIYTPAMHEHSGDNHYCYEAQTHDDEWEKREPLIDTPVSIFSSIFFDGIANDSHTGNNIVYELERCIKAGENVSFIPTTSDIPDFKGLVDEVQWLEKGYKKRIQGATTLLRDAHTSLKNLKGHRNDLPSFIKSSCFAFFGKPDFQTDFDYTDLDFRNHDWKTKNRLVSEKFLTPFIGMKIAKQVIRLIDDIMETAAPLSGEPDSLDGFGSNWSNTIPISLKEKSL